MSLTISEAFLILEIEYSKDVSERENVMHVVIGKPGQSLLSKQFRKLSKIHHPDQTLHSDHEYKQIVSARDFIIETFNLYKDLPGNSESDYDIQIVQVDEHFTRIFIKCDKPIVLELKPAYWYIKKGVTSNREYDNHFTAGHFSPDWYENSDIASMMTIYWQCLFSCEISYDDWINKSLPRLQKCQNLEQVDLQETDNQLFTSVADAEKSINGEFENHTSILFSFYREDQNICQGVLVKDITSNKLSITSPNDENYVTSSNGTIRDKWFQFKLIYSHCTKENDEKFNLNIKSFSFSCQLIEIKDLLKHI